MISFVGWMKVGWWNLPIPFCFLPSTRCNRRAHSLIPAGPTSHPRPQTFEVKRFVPVLAGASQAARGPEAVPSAPCRPARCALFSSRGAGPAGERIPLPGVLRGPRSSGSCPGGFPATRGSPRAGCTGEVLVEWRSADSPFSGRGGGRKTRLRSRNLRSGRMSSAGRTSPMHVFRFNRIVCKAHAWPWRRRTRPAGAPGRTRSFSATHVFSVPWTNIPARAPGPAALRRQAHFRPSCKWLGCFLEISSHGR